MINRILSALTLCGLSALAGYVYVRDTEQDLQIKQFMAKGPRFTAQDGQELCERVRALEQLSYGYRGAGKSQHPCNYMNRDSKP